MYISYWLFHYTTNTHEFVPLKRHEFVMGGHVAPVWRLRANTTAWRRMCNMMYNNRRPRRPARVVGGYVLVKCVGDVSALCCVNPIGALWNVVRQEKR